MLAKWTHTALNHRYHWAPFAVLVACLSIALAFPPIPGMASADEANDASGPTLLNNKVLYATWYYLMGAAHLAGAGGTQWRSTAEVCNFGNSSTSYEMQYLVYNQNNNSYASRSYSLPFFQCRRFDDVLANEFGIGSGKGTIRIETQHDANVHVAMRTYNQATNGTYGQFVVGSTDGAGVTSSEEGYLLHLTQSTSSSTGFRTNLGLQNLSSSSVTVRIEGYRSGGAYLGVYNHTLQPYEYDQVGAIFTQFTSSAVTDGFLVLTTSSGGAFLADASLVDNVTGDGTTVPMMKRR